MLKSGISDSQSPCGAKTLLPTKFEPNHMKINFWFHLGGFRPTVLPLRVKKRDNQEIRVSQFSCGAKTLLLTKFKPNTMKIDF